MKRIVSFICFIIISLASMAQMSDAQVIDYVKKQNAAGASQTQIASDLLAKGVTEDQIARIREKYENASTNNSPKTYNEESFDRSRKNNGETTPDTVQTSRKIFGHDLFRSQKLTFQPNMNIATPANYTLGPGDEVILDIYGDAQSSAKMQISPDGFVTIPDEGPVSVSGLTVAQAQNKIRRTIGSNYVGSSIKLTLGQTRTIIVNVLGEVVTPGTYTLSAFSTVFNALYLAGGITEIGTLRDIKVSRDGRIISTVDVYNFIIDGRLSGNVMLQDNDVIIVGTYDNLVKIEGKVKRPMYYEMKKDESLYSLLKYAGGFTGDAYKEKVRVERKSSEGLTVHNVDEWDFVNFRNEDEDVVVVAPIIERYKNTVNVSGAVFRPGNYKIDGNVNSVRTIIEQAGGLLEQAVTSHAVLLRLKDDRTFRTETIELGAILDGSLPDVILRNEDKLIITSYTKLATDKKMYISGQVMNPGAFDYSENTSIGDLITMAGGLTEAASLEKIEVARRITTAEDNADGNQMAKVFTFDLDKSLQAVGNTDFKLQPYDQITIHRSPNYKEQKSVFIGGEVLYEGNYTLTNKDERLSSIIKRAGGLTAKAFVSGANLVRKYTEEEINNRKLLLETAQNKADSLSAYRALQDTAYSIGFDLAKAMANPNHKDDIILMEGDVITIPGFSDVVKVSGEVLSPNTVTYQPNKTASYYINQAGGITDNGRKRKAYILYANGQVSALSKGKIEPSCEIVVPSKIEKKTDTAKVSMWAVLASTVSAIGVMVSNIVK